MKIIFRFWYGLELAELDGSLYLLELDDTKYRITPKTPIQFQQAYQLLFSFADNYTKEITARHNGFAV